MDKVSSRRSCYLTVMLLAICSVTVMRVNAQPLLPVAIDEQQLIAEQQKQQRIKLYLANAYEALDDLRLMQPKHNSAYDWFNQVLWLDGAHPQAHWGMREIGKIYLRLAEQAYQQQARTQAQQYLQRALWVSASQQDVDALKLRYPTPTVATPAVNNEFSLSVADLAKKNLRIIEQLQRLAEQAKSTPSRLLIVARSDAEGRWIYKQMRDALSGYRLRGNIQLGSVPKVVLIDMPQAGKLNSGLDG